MLTSPSLWEVFLWAVRLPSCPCIAKTVPCRSCFSIIFRSAQLSSSWIRVFGSLCALFGWYYWGSSKGPHIENFYHATVSGRSICLCLALTLSLSLSLSLFMSLCLSLCLSVSRSLCLSVSLFLSLGLSGLWLAGWLAFLCVSVCLSACVCLCLSESVSVSVRVSVHLYLCLSVSVCSARAMWPESSF